MAAQFNFITSGSMLVQLEGLMFGNHMKDPVQNVKTYAVSGNEVTLDAANENTFTDWGEIELLEAGPGPRFITVTIDSPNWGWYGTAQFSLYVNGQNILNDNFQSGVRGPVGDPRRVKRYAVGTI